MPIALSASQYLIAAKLTLKICGLNLFNFAQSFLLISRILCVSLGIDLIFLLLSLSFLQYFDTVGRVF